jgi:hypothetical protein
LLVLSQLTHFSSFCRKMKLEWKALPHPPFNNSRQHLYHATRSFFHKGTLLDPHTTKAPLPLPNGENPFCSTFVSCNELSFYKGTLLGPQQQVPEPPSPPPLGWMSTHQHTMQDGCCVDRKHFFINILCPIVNGVSYVLTIHMHPSTCMHLLA